MTAQYKTTSAKTNNPIRRRRVLQQGAGLASGIVVSSIVSTPDRSFAGVPASELAKYDPFGPAKLYFDYMRPIMFDIKKGKPYLDALWERYVKDRDSFDGERALMGVFLMWRMLESKSQRIHFARIGQRMAAEFTDRHPKHPAGTLWGGIFFGSEALAKGVLESVHLVPAIEKRFRAAHKVDPGYLNGIAATLLAKLYIKTPSFPISKGSLKKGKKFLDEASQYAEGVFGPWYIVLAEYELLANGEEAAYRAFQRLRDEVKIENMKTVDLAYGLDTSLADAEMFELAIRSGKYNKYLYDVWLLVSKPYIK